MNNHDMKKKRSLWDRLPGKGMVYGHTLLFWPFIVAGGRLVVRVIMNTWNMLED